MVLIKKYKKKNGDSIEVFSERIGGKTVYFVSKVTKNKISSGQADNRKHALSWGKRLSK